MYVTLFDICRRHPDKFRIAGNVQLDQCPVCASTDHPTIWQLPQQHLERETYLSSPGSPYHNTYISDLPMLTTPQAIFIFDMCQNCEAIFLNPKYDDQAAYEKDESKVRAYRQHGLDSWRAAADDYWRHAPEGTRTVVDAACGAGQMLAVYREGRPELKLVGLEISRPSVAWMREELGLDGHLADLDRDDLDPIVPPGSVDYVIMNESYEHVRTPTVTIAKLVRMLRPGGRIRFSAQSYGPEYELQIRVSEPIYISERTLEYTAAATGTKLIDPAKSAKMHITLEKM